MIALTDRIEQAGTVDGCLTLPYDQRIKSRLRVHLDDGREAGIFLQRGMVLRDGDLLASDSGQVILIKAAAEKVSTVKIGDPLLMARACYHLGNRHIPVEISAGMVRYQADHVLDGMLKTMGLTVVHDLAGFEPESGAYSHGHHHHEHAH